MDPRSSYAEKAWDLTSYRLREDIEFKSIIVNMLSLDLVSVDRNLVKSADIYFERFEVSIQTVYRQTTDKCVVSREAIELRLG